MSQWDQLPADQVINSTAEALRANGFSVDVAENSEEAKIKALEHFKKGDEVFQMTSMTLDETGISKEINESGNYDAVRPKLFSMDKKSEGREMQKMGAAPANAIGSVHAVTEDGKLVIASNTGSQLPAYAYGADQVVWVVSTQKIVKNLDDAMKRIYEHVLPLESERAHKAYGVPGSFVSKMLIINKEVSPNRAHIILVKEKLGF
jgi:L-lactate utilization protein LutC